MPQKTFAPAEVRVEKQGVSKKNGRPWTLFTVRATDGSVFSTFNRAWQEWIGKTVTADYIITEKGDWRLEAPPDTPQTPPPARMPQDGPQNGERGLDRLEVLERKVEAIKALLEHHFKAP